MFRSICGGNFIRSNRRRTTTMKMFTKIEVHHFVHRLIVSYSQQFLSLLNVCDWSVRGALQIPTITRISSFVQVSAPEWRHQWIKCVQISHSRYLQVKRQATDLMRYRVVANRCWIILEQKKKWNLQPYASIAAFSLQFFCLFIEPLGGYALKTETEVEELG